jgi:hypothetical protein
MTRGRLRKEETTSPSHMLGQLESMVSKLYKCHTYVYYILELLVSSGYGQ